MRFPTVSNGRWFRASGGAATVAASRQEAFHPFPRGASFRLQSPCHRCSLVFRLQATDRTVCRFLARPCQAFVLSLGFAYSL